MTGKQNGVASLLRKESKIMLNAHCICHRLALTCSDANDDVAYIKTVEKVLVQLNGHSLTTLPKRLHPMLRLSKNQRRSLCQKKGRKELQRSSRKLVEPDGYPQRGQFKEFMKTLWL